MWKSYKNKPRKVTMRRSVYVEITAVGKVTLTTPYASRKFVLNDGDQKSIDLISLKEIPATDSSSLFYAEIYYMKDSYTVVDVMVNSGERSDNVETFMLGSEKYRGKGKIRVNVVEDA